MTRREKIGWIALLYFAQGFPFGIVADNLPVYLRVHDVSLTQIGLLSGVLGMPWTAKFLWAPLVDVWGSTRAWISGALLLMALVLYVLPFLPPSPPGFLLWAVLLGFTLASATQDIAIDAHSIRMLERGEEGMANGVRVSAYRAALIVSGGGLVMLSGWLAWTGVFHAAAGILVLLAWTIWQRLPAVDRGGGATQAWSGTLWKWLQRPRGWLLFLVVLTFKLGDSSMGPMVKPFWVDRGFSPEEIGLVSTTFGVALSVAGALLGGWCTSRWGIRRGLVIFGLLQAVSNLGYAAAAAFGAGRPGVYAASFCESFTGGLGTAAFLAFLMRCCDKRNAATEYALLSAVFGLTRQVAGTFSGWATTVMGYATYFGATFLVALPPLLLLAWLPADLDAERPAATDQPEP